MDCDAHRANEGLFEVFCGDDLHCAFEADCRFRRVCAALSRHARALFCEWFSRDFKSYHLAARSCLATIHSAVTYFRPSFWAARITCACQFAGMRPHRAHRWTVCCFAPMAFARCLRVLNMSIIDVISGLCVMVWSLDYCFLALTLFEQSHTRQLIYFSFYQLSGLTVDRVFTSVRNQTGDLNEH